MLFNAVNKGFKKLLEEIKAGGRPEYGYVIKNKQNRKLYKAIMAQPAYTFHEARERYKYYSHLLATSSQLKRAQ